MIPKRYLSVAKLNLLPYPPPGTSVYNRARLASGKGACQPLAKPKQRISKTLVGRCEKRNLIRKLTKETYGGTLWEKKLKKG
jgi:hypothetical protein